MLTRHNTEELQALPSKTDWARVLADPPTPRRRGPQKAPKKQKIALRLAPDVVERYKATGPGWHQRIEAVLREHAPD